MRKRIYKRVANLISKIILENIPFFILLGILSFFGLEYSMLNDFKDIMHKYVIPVVVTYTAGRTIENKFGGITAVIVMGGVLSKYSFQSFLGPILIGVIAGIVIRKYREQIKKIPYPGYEMILNNLGTVFISLLLIMLFVYILPVYGYVQVKFLNRFKETIFNITYFPLFSVIIEPAKVFFLNNLINHGVLSVLGLAELNEKGKSIFFLLETNPGPGLGVLLAYYFYEKKKQNHVKTKDIASNIFIQFIGGIHEVYFPYVLRRLTLIPALIMGGVTAVYIFQRFDAGLVGVASPGSIIMLLVLAPVKDKIIVFFGVMISTVVTFLISYYILNRKEIMNGKKEIDNMFNRIYVNEKIKYREKINIYVVCDAGMGSSAMGATLLERKIKKAGIRNIKVDNSSVDRIPENGDIIIVHKQLLNRIDVNESEKNIITIDDFMDSKFYDILVEKLKNTIDSDIVLGKERKNIINIEKIVREEKLTEEINKKYKTKRSELMKDKKELNIEKENKEQKENRIENIVKNKKILYRENIQIGLKRTEKEKALKNIGKELFEKGYVTEEYIETILEREKVSSTYLSYGIAIPHGSAKGTPYIKQSGIVIHQYPYGIDYGDGKIVYIIIGIAALKDKHIQIISKLAELIDNEKISEQLSTAIDIEEIYQIFLDLEEEIC
ncbi:PTS system mannitol-specific IIC component [Hypnocyclicus thermotrophus]|uniref:PTS system mannitol-specific IIC component n=1 Tax=Hypnocyclicus thermotrophus TaxID=1627895 RepID=A0AA46DWQ5_9FUSO|nr:PTS sugar transporter subunit IIA [Hypnocyclicus thermotrophus]TDT66989.1 PTS system mannitol-specific IIC component [Hypnocyclicus thermotrophus]